MSAFLLKFTLYAGTCFRQYSLLVGLFAILQQTANQEANTGNQCDDGGNQQVRSDIVQAVLEKLSAPGGCAAHEDSGGHIPGTGQNSGDQAENCSNNLIIHYRILLVP